MAVHEERHPGEEPIRAIPRSEQSGPIESRGWFRIGATERDDARLPCDIASAFKRVCTLADLKVTDDGHVVFHSLRHTGISRLANHPEIPLVHVRDFARHSDLAVTQGYVHRIESDEVKTAMAEALA